MRGMGGVFGGGAMMAMQPQQQEQKKRWLDGGKFGWKDGLALALGAVGDGLTGRPQTSQLILQSAQQRRAQEQALEAEQRAMANQKELIGYKAQVGAQYAKPQGPTSLQRNTEWFASLTPEQQAQMLPAIDAVSPLISNTAYGATFIPRGSLGQGASQAPRAGQVEGGYRFKGGDPANPDNWEAI